MFRNVVVGVDEHHGHDAIQLAKRLLAVDGKLTLAHVYIGEPQAWRRASPVYDAEERERALELLSTARGEARIDAELRCAASPSVGHGLHTMAEASHADLLVVGSSRRGLLGRVLLGDETRAALNGAPCAVAIAPAGHAQDPDMVREVGVAYDGSSESEHALRVARELAAEYGAKLSAFEAVTLPAFLFTGGPAPVDISIQQFVDEARERIAALGGVEPHAAYGHPADELALYSASLDLLVVGSRDYGPIGRLVHGSTSQQLAHKARCPLLVLTRAARAAATSATEAENGGVALAGKA